MKVLIINGVNLNMVGIREPEKYGTQSYKDLVKYCKECAKTLNIKVEIFQSNYEGEIVTKIQKSKDKFDGIIINAGAYTHTSIAILDTLKAVDIPTIEVHLTDIYQREEFRHVSFISYYATKTIAGKGFEGYKEALETLQHI